MSKKYTGRIYTTEQVKKALELDKKRVEKEIQTLKDRLKQHPNISKKNREAIEWKIDIWVKYLKL